MASQKVGRRVIASEGEAILFLEVLENTGLLRHPALAEFLAMTKTRLFMRASKFVRRISWKTSC